MFLYNVTVIIDEAIQDEWLAWMMKIQIPEIMATDIFISNRMLKVLDSPNEGITYCIQYIADSHKKLEQYLENQGAAFQLQHAQKFENKFVTFSTLLEYINYQ